MFFFLFKKGLLDSLANANFMHFINGFLMADKIRLERNVFLFFYCSDIAIRLLRRKANSYFQETLEWSVKLIIQRIFLMVKKSGGYTAINHFHKSNLSYAHRVLSSTPITNSGNKD